MNQSSTGLHSAIGKAGGSIQRSLPLLIAPALILGLAACGKSSQPDTTVAASDSAAQAASSAAPAADPGPAMLSTVGLFETQRPASIKAAQGSFAFITPPGGGLKHLTVNGTPWTYNTDIGSPSSPIEANDDLYLVGVIELPHESVAWVIITGGTACAATHVLVSIKDGMPINGSAIPGCDDRGTLRRVGDHIVLEAGGSTGTYRAGRLTLETRGDRAAAQ